MIVDNRCAAALALVVRHMYRDAVRRFWMKRARELASDQSKILA